VVNKTSELHHLLYIDNYDIAFITETWLHNDIPNGLLDPNESYNVVRKDRICGKGGGVCALVSKRWDIVHVNFDDQFHDIDVICFDLVCSNRVRFFVIYRPPYYDNSAA